MPFRNFILFSNIQSFEIALGIVPPSENQGVAEKLILPLVAKGDEAAMKRCIDSYGPLVWSIVCRRINERVDAEEACQEIFTEVWRIAERFDSKVSKESTFIGMIARRRSIDWQRKQNRLPALANLDSLPELSTPSISNLHSIDRSELWNILNELPSDTLHLFSLHFEKGLTHDEIARQTKLPIGTVKTKLRRGLIEARKLLKEFNNGEGVAQ
jgi:RNA polymerase sigma-70 factor (ECF subfamily)